MADQGAVREKYAILIGINAYQEKPLACCVKDVNSIRAYLEGLPGPINIQMFAADNVTGLDLSSSNKKTVRWPSYDNVTSALAMTTSLASPGDFVYLHFSGHGTRVAPNGEFSNESTGDLALVLLGDDRKAQHLWGPRLALSLKAMVDKGVVVTVVLDCCFSASAYRQDDRNIRFLSCNATVDPRFSLDVLSQESTLVHEANDSVSRNASVTPNWLINPGGYAILAACGPHEEASELAAEDGQTHGALSYFLLRALIKCGGLAKKHRDIYDHLCVEFRKFWPRQSPVLYGNKDQRFFDQDDLEIVTRTGASVIANEHGKFEILAGQAHGISIGDHFGLRSPGSEHRDIGSTFHSKKAKVVQTRAFTSVLVLLGEASIDIKTGWIATALSQSSLQKFSIALAAGLPQTQAIQDALRERSLGVGIDDGNLVSCHVAQTSDGGYEILDESRQRIIHLPTKGQEQPDVGPVCDLIVHLARFRLLKDLSNMTVGQSFKESFSVRINTSSGHIFYADSLLEVDHEAKIEVFIENTGSKELYVFVYDMSPSFQITNLVKGSYECLPSRNQGLGFTGIFRKKIRMKIPLQRIDRGLRDCEDIIKIFVTSLPTTFDSFELPKLCEPALNKSYKQTAVKRSDLDSGSHTSEDWVAVNFRVRTSL